MTKLFGVRIDKLVDQNVSKGLLPAVITSRADGARDPNDITGGVKAGSPTIHKCKAISNSYRDNEIDGELIKRSDRKILVGALSIKPAIVPTMGMMIEISDEPGAVYRIESSRRDPASATYILQGRLG